MQKNELRLDFLTQHHVGNHGNVSNSNVKIAIEYFLLVFEDRDAYLQ